MPDYTFSGSGVRVDGVSDGKIAQKVGEEAVETVIAAKNEPADEFIYEAGDLLFHLMLLCVQKNIPMKTIIDELESRHSK